MRASQDHGTYSVALARAKLAFVAANGLDVGAYRDVLGITERELEDPDARLAIAPALRFWELLVRELDDCAVPVRFAQRIGAADFGVLGFAVMTAATVEDGLRRAARYYAVLADTAELRVARAGALIRVELVRPGERTLALRIMNENTVACMLSVMRSVVRADIAPVRVAFRHRAPEPLTAHARFFRAPLDFEAGWDGLEFHHSVLGVVPPLQDPGLRSFFERHAENILSRLERATTLGDRVRAALAQAFTDGEPTLAQIARRLGMSDRTLRRGLDGEGAGFRALVDAVRKELAVEYLARARTTTTEIAYLLGFSEASAFTRAFRRWYGCSPRAYRGRVD